MLFFVVLDFGNNLTSYVITWILKYCVCMVRVRRQFLCQLKCHSVWEAYTNFSLNLCPSDIKNVCCFLLLLSLCVFSTGRG